MDIPDLPEGAQPIYDVDGTSGFPEMIGSLNEQVYSMARESGNAPKNFREDVEAFIAAVDWSEKWIRALIAFQLVLWVTTVVTRNRFNWQVATFFFVSILVWGSETINTYAHLNWKAFSTQDYFELFFDRFRRAASDACNVSDGEFPLDAANLLVDVKREELQRKGGGGSKANKKESDKKSE
eukprot:CAMPEP_0171672812 /NCGR_PEP_ID=MMETSP0990-20121206/52205_1 /TAXON_ID=483369 /ORGANISM="non described non described, Strain CCMP2098" /LENGTH=181 /DNA_ID=CAMNT_0012258159 /DNA_START=100 /DNA_END=646 /DNA_ORIENTATION=+